MSEPGFAAPLEVVEHPRRRADVIEAEVDGSRFLFDPVRVRAHVLNPSATIVWDRLDGSPVPALVDEVARAAGVAAAPIAADVRTTIRHLADEGLLVPEDRAPHDQAPHDQAPHDQAPHDQAPHDQAPQDPDPDDRDPTEPVTAGRPGTGPGPPHAPGTFANVPHTDEPAPEALADLEFGPRSGPYRGLDVTWWVETTDAELGTFLDAVLAPLRLPASEPVPVDAHRYRIVGTGSPIEPGTVALDEHLVSPSSTRADLTGLVLWHMNQLVSTGSQARLLIHASAVLDPRTDGVVLFPASMNSGKSTLVAALVRAGYRYVTDETVGLDVTTGLVHPYPKAIGLDPGSWALLPELEPATRASHPTWSRYKWFTDVEAAGFAAPARRPRPVTAIVFPAYQAAGPTRIEAVSPASAALDLATNCFNLVAVGPAGVDRIVTTVTERPAHRLVMDDPDRAVAAVGALLAAP